MFTKHQSSDITTHLCLLFFQHLIKNRHNPLLELDVVVIGYQEISDAIDSLQSQLPPRKTEISEEGRSQTFDEILLNATSSGHNYIYHVVPDEVSERISDARGDEVRGVAEKDRAVCDRSISWFVQVRFLFLVRDRVSPSLQLHRVRCKDDAYHMLNS
jgi:hypothetical protein